MRKLSGKKLILGLMALILCVMACAPAFASTGDRILVHQTTMDGYLPETVQTVVPCGNGFIIVKYTDSDVTVEQYADAKAEPEVFVQTDKARQEDGASYVNPWFSWNGELYGFDNRSSYTEESSMAEVLVRHVKLENGEVILEESGLPELDLSGVLEGEAGEQYMPQVPCIFVMDDKLFMAVYGYNDDSNKLEMIDLQDGSCTEIEITGDFDDIVPGPEGTVLITRREWDAESSTDNVKVNSLDLKTQEEKEITVFAGLENGRVNPCYDRKTDVLYIIKDGEIWAVPQFDMEQAAAVNDCPNTGDGAMLLPDGFVLIWMYDTVMIKNTDPAQRGSITLRVSDRGYGETMTETVYDMNNKRGDVSVVVRPEWGKRSDIVQAMLNRDGSTDVYSMQADDNEFAALRKRGYLPDLSGNEKIAASINRLYPYIQEAVKQDGKELPKTWTQFFDWLETLPARLEGQDVSVIAPYEDRSSFRAYILEALLSQYEVRMEKKGETDYYFATPEMCELVRRLDSLDYEALQIRVIEDEDEEVYYDDYDEKTPLLDNMTGLLFQDGSAYTPLALSFSEEEEPVLPIEVSIAFMNPYSEHPQEAMDFLALAADNLYGLDQYAAYTDKTEPARYSGYEYEKEYYLKRIEDLKEQIEKAEDGDDKAMLEEFLQNAEEELELLENDSWIVSSEQIERYKQWQGYFRAKGYSFLNVLYATSNEEEDAETTEYDRVFYESFGMKPEELLGMLDKKVRMIRMEGN